MDMGMVSLVMKSRIPPQMVHWNLEIFGKGRRLSPEEIPPTAPVVEAQPGGIFPFQGEDVRPYLSSVVVQFFHGLCQVHAVLITKQTMPPSRSALGRVAMYFM